MKKNYLKPQIEATILDLASVLCANGVSGADGEETTKEQMPNPFSAPARPF